MDQMGDHEMAEERPDKGHNLTKINAAIVKASDDALAKEAEIAKAKAAYVKHLQDDLKRIWQNAKADTGIPIGRIKAIHKLRTFDAKGDDIEDDDERREFQDHFRIAFSALAKDGRLNFLDVMDAMGGETTTTHPVEAAA